MKFAAVMALLAGASAEMLFEVDSKPQDVTVDITALEAQKEFEVVSGSKITVVAKEIRSTGYMWFVTKNTCGVRAELKGDDYQKHPLTEGDEQWGQLYGAAGKRVFQF